MTTDRARLPATALKSVVLPIALLTAGMIGLGFLVIHVLVHIWPFTIEGQAWWVLLLIVPVAVATSRMYRGMHYPSDVTAGFLAGLGCLWIMRRAILAPAEQRGSREA